MSSGLATGIYTTNSPDACWYVANSAECNVIVVDSDKQLQKILKVRARLPHLRAVVQYNEPLRQNYDNVYTVYRQSRLWLCALNDFVVIRVGKSFDQNIRCSNVMDNVTQVLRNRLKL